MDSLQSALINEVFVYFAIRACVIMFATLIMPPYGNTQRDSVEMWN